MQENQPKINSYRLTWQILFTMAFAVGLWAIFAPVYTSQGQSGTKISCLSNIKQMSLATLIYASDNNDAAPSNYSFDGAASQILFTKAIFPYTKNKSLLLCAKEQKDMKGKTAPPGQEGIPGIMDFVHCLSLRGVIPDFSTGKRILKETSLKDPAKVPYLRDPIRGYGAAKDNKVVGFLSPHGGGFNTAFFDGHAKYVRNPNINTDI